MIKAELNIKQWGNNLGVRLPVALVRAAQLRADQRVCLSVENGNIIIRPLEVPLTLEQRLAKFDPDRHSGEVMIVEPMGAERF